MNISADILWQRFSPMQTPRLLLRGVREADLGDLLSVNSNDEVTRHLPYASWRSLDDAWAWYRRIADLQTKNSCAQFAIVQRDSEQVIGSCLLHRYDPGSARAEIGYVLGRPHWGRGLMVEALRAVIAAAFAQADLRRLEAEIDPRNLGSLAVIEKLGFTREGLLRERWVSHGLPHDVAVFGLLRKEWSDPR